jgi:hypothetical protein
MHFKKHLFLTLFFALLMTNTPAQTRKTSKYSWNAGLISFDQSNKSPSHHNLSGWLFGIDSSFFFKRIISSELDIQYAYGSTTEHFENPIGNIPSTYLRIQVLIHPFDHLTRLDLFAGIGYEASSMKVHDQSLLNHYRSDQSSTIIYLPLGFKQTFHPKPKIKISPILQTNYLISAQLNHKLNTSTLVNGPISNEQKPAYTTLSNQIKQGLGFVLACNIETKINQLTLAIKPYWSYWVLEKSRNTTLDISVAARHTFHPQQVSYPKEIRNQVGVTINVLF